MGRFLRWSVALVLGMGVALSASGALANGVDALTSFSQNPAQLGVTAVLFVKVDPKTSTDTILVINRQQVDDVTTTGSAITIHLRFYDADCHLQFDNNAPVTPQGVFVDTASHLFGVSAPGVVLANVATGSNKDGSVNIDNDKFALSSVVIDGNFGAIYERQGSPLLNNPGHVVASDISNWAGFSSQTIDDWFIGGVTMLQMICAGPGLAGTDLGNDMGFAFFLSPLFNVIATDFADRFRVVNVYDAKEVLKRSIHDVPCFCNTDTAFFGKDSRFPGYPGDFVDVIASMKAVGFGTFHAVPIQCSECLFPEASLISWRTISNGATVYWTAPLRTTPNSNNPGVPQ